MVGITFRIFAALVSGSTASMQPLDRPLPKGNWVGFRECHVGGDLLLIYRLDAESKQEQIVFVRTGTHADLFEE
ncbi:type II toxin-antitoxin system YafQ family toxin [Pseudomonas helleri]|uniref:type II toxin-antitoxin system YafQ family toxin n=1 Tax=Pseudomonas helleri TaxID=1608996 RepID=UPI003FCF95F3